MVDTGALTRQFPYGALLILSRLTGAIFAVLVLHFCMWLFSIQMRDPYLALTIIAALLALIIFPGTRVDDMQPGPRFWSNSVSVVGR